MMSLLDNLPMQAYVYVERLGGAMPIEKSANLQGSAASPAGVAVSRVASAGKTRVACRGVGRVRQRQAGQVLQTVGEGPQSTGERGIELAPPGGSRGPHSADSRIGVRRELVEITFWQRRSGRATR